MPIATKFADGARFSSSQISTIKVLRRQLHTDVPEAAATAFRVSSVVAPESQTACGQDGPIQLALNVCDTQSRYWCDAIIPQS